MQSDKQVHAIEAEHEHAHVLTRSLASQYSVYLVFVKAAPVTDPV